MSPFHTRKLSWNLREDPLTSSHRPFEDLPSMASPSSVQLAREFLALHIQAADSTVRLRQICVLDHSANSEPHIHALLHFSDGSCSQWLRLDVEPTALRAAGAELGYRLGWHMHDNAVRPNRGVSPTLMQGLHSCTVHLSQAEAQALQRNGTCTVCLNEFATGDAVLCIPCRGEHIIHWGCIEPWLKTHNTCPTCRFELPTDSKTSAEDVATLMETSRAGIQRLRAAVEFGQGCEECAIPQDGPDERNTSRQSPGFFAAAFKRLKPPHGGRTRAAAAR